MDCLRVYSYIVAWMDCLCQAFLVNLLSSTLYSIQYTLYSIQYTLQYTVYSKFRYLFTNPSSLNIDNESNLNLLIVKSATTALILYNDNSVNFFLTLKGVNSWPLTLVRTADLWLLWEQSILQTISAVCMSAWKGTTDPGTLAWLLWEQSIILLTISAVCMSAWNGTSDPGTLAWLLWEQSILQTISAVCMSAWKGTTDPGTLAWQWHIKSHKIFFLHLSQKLYQISEVILVYFLLSFFLTLYTKVFKSYVR